MFAAHRTTGAETQNATQLVNLRQRHPQNDPQTQAFQQHLDENGGNNTEPHSTYGSHEVNSNNAGLYSSTNTGLFEVGTNKSELDSHNNAGHFSVNENKNSLNTFGNQDQVSVGTNHFNMSSNNNHGVESVDNNKYKVNIQGSAGKNNFGSNTGTVEVHPFKQGGQAHFDHQSGTVIQHLGPSILPEVIRPSHVTHGPTGKPLTLDEYGSHNLTNVTGNFQRNPLAAAAGYGGAALNTFAVPLGVGINNWASAPVSIKAAHQLAHPKAD